MNKLKFSKCMQLALSNIISNKTRSLLTMLGIIIGIMSVITLVSLMNGMTGEITSMFDELGTTTITVSIQSRGGSRRVTEDDIYKIAADNNDIIAGVSPSVTVSSTVKIPSSSDTITTRTTGVSEVYADMTKTVIEQGSFFEYIDVERMQNVCVIGTYIQRNFFGMQSPLGQTVKINGEPFTVVGVIEERADSTEGSTDDCIYIPFTNACRLNGNTTISSFNVYATEEEAVDRAVEAIESELLRVLGSSDFFRVTSMLEMLDMVNEITGMMTTALVFIAGISLLVGGIGIMNIMLVTVTERTKEIGIRKALGTRRRDILNQFIIEAATLSGIGGIIGIFAGIGLSSLVGKLMDMSAAPSVGAILISFGISAAIGIIFGYLPAKNAAALNPIDALRFE